MPTYLIDGHNLLYAARQSFLDHLVDGHPGTAAREELVRRLVAAFATPGQAAYLYFDGSEAKTEMRSAQVQVILQGFKAYGLILADNGSAWFLSGAPDERWDDGALRDLKRLRGSDFEAVDVRSLIIDPDDGAAAR